MAQPENPSLFAKFIRSLSAAKDDGYISTPGKMPLPPAQDTAPYLPPPDPAEKSGYMPIMGQELGVTQESFWTRFELYQYNPDELVSKKGYRIFEKMATDDTINMCLNALKMMRLSSGFEIVQASDDPIDIQIADEVADNFDFMMGSLQEKIFSILGALEMGWSIHEKVWDFWDGGPWKGHVRLSGLKSKNPQWYNPAVDDFNNITGIVLISPPAYARKLPHQKFLVYSAQKRYENVGGSSRIRSLYDWWYLKGIAKAAISVLVKKYGKDTPIGKVPPTMSPADKQAALSALVNLATKAAVIMPEGVQIEYAKMDFQTINGCLAVVEKADQQMTKILMGQTASSGTSSGQTHKGGSQQGGGTGGGAGTSAGRAQEQTLQMYLDFIGNDVAANAIAPIIKDIVDFNYQGVVKYPKFRFRPPAQEDIGAIVHSWVEAVQSGAAVHTDEDEEYVRELLGFPSLANKTTLRPNRFKTQATVKVTPPHQPVNPPSFPTGGYRPPTPSAPGLPANYAEAEQMPTVFYLVRHGQTEYDSGDRSEGWIDMPMDAVGKQEAQAIADDFEGIHLDHIYTSDLARTQETARLIKAAAPAPITKEAALRTLSFGDWDGEMRGKIKKVKTSLIDEWANDPNASAPNGESWKDFQDRVLGFFKQVVKDSKPGQRIAIVCHGRVVDLIQAYIFNDMKPITGTRIAEVNKMRNDRAMVTSISYYPASKRMIISRTNSLPQAQFAESDWTPPEAGDAPAAVKGILKAVYAKIRDQQYKDDKAGIESPEKKASAAKQAWAAVHNAGWTKDSKGAWHKHSEDCGCGHTLALFAEGFKPFRPLTPFEKHTDFAEILTTMEKDGTQQIAEAAAAVIHKGVNKIKLQAKRTLGDSAAIRKMKLPYQGELAATLRDGLQKVARKAMTQARAEISAKRAGTKFAEPEGQKLIRLALDEINAAKANLKEHLAAGKMSRAQVAKEWAHHVADYKDTVSQNNGRVDQAAIRFAEQDNFDSMAPEEVLQLINDRAFTMAGDISSTVLSKVQQAMYDGIKTGDSYKDIVYAIENAIAPYIDLTAAAGDLSGARLMTAVRTNVSTAYNDARDSIFADPDLDGFVQAFQYSAILDGQTTPGCRGMDGRIFKATNPIWDTWDPPVHYNCRSIKIPVTKADGWDGEESALPTIPPAGF